MALRLRLPTLVPLLAFMAGAMAAVAQASPPASAANGPRPSSLHGSALATVEASPRAVLRHDKAGWLRLFARNARLQDPVGSPWLERGLSGNDPLAQFYDVFIAPSSIHFEAHRDYVDGRDVLRDVTIRTELAPHCVVEVPAFVHYELADDGSTQRLASLAAHWELATNFDQVRSQWWACARSSLALSSRMVQHLGLGYSVGYTGALRTVGAEGKTQTFSLLSSVVAGDREAFLEHFSDDAQIQCPLHGAGFMQSPSSFWSTLQDANVAFAVLDKTIAAGRTVSLRVRLWANGWSRESVLLVTYAREGLRIERLRCFL